VDYEVSLLMLAGLNRILSHCITLVRNEESRGVDKDLSLSMMSGKWFRCLSTYSIIFLSILLSLDMKKADVDYEVSLLMLAGLNRVLSHCIILFYIPFSVRNEESRC